jgi:uncharacterized membrane protein YuzA (DUF378 family)
VLGLDEVAAACYGKVSLWVATGFALLGLLGLLCCLFFQHMTRDEPS